MSFQKLLCLVFCLLVFLKGNAAVYTVTSDSSAGLGSFLAALDSANADPNWDEIQFNIPGAGPHTILFSGPYELLGPVKINGYSQPGATFPNPTIVLDGSLGFGQGIELLTSDVEVTGMVTQSFASAVFFVSVQIASNLVAGNWNFHGNTVSDGTLLEISANSGTIRNVNVSENQAIGKGRLLEIEASATFSNSIVIDSVHFKGNQIRLTDLYGGNACELQIHGNSSANHVWVEDNEVEVANPTQSGTFFLATAVPTTLGLAELGNVVIRNNTVFATVSTPGYDGIVFQMGDDFCIQGRFHHITIDSNEVRELGAALRLNNAGGWTNEGRMEFVAISDNHFLGNSYGIDITGWTHPGSTFMTDIQVQRNILAQSTDYGVHLRVVRPLGTVLGDRHYNRIDISHNEIFDGSGGGIVIEDENAGFHDLAAGIQGITMFQNSIHDNLHWNQLIDTVLNSVSDACPLPVPNIFTFNLPAPFTVRGELLGMPNTAYHIEFFAGPEVDGDGGGESENFLGADTLLLDSAGRGIFAYPAPALLPNEFVTATATNLTTLNTGCLSRPVAAVVVAVEGADLAGLPTIFPNPVTDRNLHVTGLKAPLRGLELINEMGTVLPLSVEEAVSDGLDLQLPELPAGIYVLRIQVGKEWLTRKLVVLR